MSSKVGKILEEYCSMSLTSAAARKTMSSKASSLFLGDVWMRRLCGGLISFQKNPSYKQISKLLWQTVSLSWECLPLSSTGQDLAKPLILKHNQWVETSRNHMLLKKVPAKQAGSLKMAVGKVVGTGRWGWHSFWTLAARIKFGSQRTTSQRAEHIWFCRGTSQKSLINGSVPTHQVPKARTVQVKTWFELYLLQIIVAVFPSSKIIKVLE